jgi:hypothetical protein
MEKILDAYKLILIHTNMEIAPLSKKALRVLMRQVGYFQTFVMKGYAIFLLVKNAN